MPYSCIDLEREAEIAILRLNDPTSRNALTLQMIDEINYALDDASDWGRALILTGAGGGFCSGANLTGGLLRDASDNRPAASSILESHLNPLMCRLRDAPFPWITAVNGAAAGAGCSFALAADLVVCGESAFFLQAFSRIGLVPDAGSSWLLARSIGRARAMEMMLLADRIPAAKAMEWGMVNRLVPDSQVMPTALELAARLAAGPTQSLAATRRLTWAAANASFDEALAMECEFQQTARASSDHREGVAAFREKRAPRFTGR